MDLIKLDLEVNKDVMVAILDNYKTTYVMNKLYNTPEYSKMMTNVESNINSEFASLRAIQNDLQKKITEQQNKLASNVSLLKNVKSKYAKLSKERDSGDIYETTMMRDVNNASGTRYDNTKTAYMFARIYMGIQVLSILGLGILFYYTSKRSSTDNIKKNLTNVKNILTSTMENRGKVNTTNIPTSSNTTTTTRVPLIKQPTISLDNPATNPK